MNVLIVGLLCIAAYGVILAAWLLIDVNRSDYAATEREDER